MAGGCRDCHRCLETGFMGCMMLPIRMILFCCGGFLVGFFRQHCPQCRHAMSQHRWIGGRLAD